MKLNTYLPIILAGLAGATAANAQIGFTLTGSTAFRSITIDRGLALFDTGSTFQTNNATTGLITGLGTMSNAIPSLGNNQVKLRLSFSGSIEGMNDVKNLAAVTCAEIGGGSTNVVPDVALSDVFPATANPPIPNSTFQRVVIGIVPIVFVKNNGIAGLTNLTQDSATFLMAANGPGIPQNFFGGTSGADVYFIGRDSGSGTRLTAEKCTKFSGSPTLWTTNGAGAYVTTNGLPSGGLVKNVVQGKTDSIGYLSLGDYSGSFTNSATVLNYNGIPFNITNVYNGKFTIWGYQHMMSRTSGGLSATQQLIFNALKTKITDINYQSTNSLYKGRFGELNAMEVQRNVDGGPLSSLIF